MQATVKNGVLTISIPLASRPMISNTEAAKALKEGREARALVLASSGGFVRAGGDTPCRVSLNVLTA